MSSEFFDDSELVLLLQDSSQQYYLATTVYSEYFSASDPSSGTTLTKPLNINRSRALSLSTRANEAEVIGLAVNGSKGRRVGCVNIGDGTEIKVWDMDTDEGQDGQDEVSVGDEVEDEEM